MTNQIEYYKLILELLSFRNHIFYDVVQFEVHT